MAAARAEREKKPVGDPNKARAMLIVNPVAGTGEAEKIWEELKTLLNDLGLDFEYEFTEYPEHAIEIAGTAAKQGYGIVVAVGGDGTIYEITNGLMTVAREARPALGIIPCGRGSDFCRTVQVPQDWHEAVSLLVSGKRRTIDVGRMEYKGRNREDSIRYYANIAGLGFDGEVTERANNMPEKLAKAVGGIGTYLLSLLITYVTYKQKDVELHIDDERYRVLAATVVIANCRYFGGKMCVAPDAVCDDGLFDVVVIGAGFGPPAVDIPPGTLPPSHNLLQRMIAKVKMAKNVPAIYKGNHIKDESVMVMRGAKVEVISKDRLVLQADGEVIGEGPLTAEIVKGAIDIIA